ncbi:MAG: hypothetical protein NC191_04770 [Muribaculaceae bacterium]|nr:hypothetical protein [Muribaculaceae bacterium]
MAYIKNDWKDQSVERPKTYEMTNNPDGSVTLIDSFGLVNELGTPVNADNMNRIEEGIAGCDLRKYNLLETYEKGEWVTGVVDDVKGIYESLVSNNYGNSLTDTEKWQKVELGGSNSGSGLSLFTLIQQDHILSFEESMGYAQLGTYVCSMGVSGSRYGYPDFVNKCIEEMKAGTATQVTLGSNTVTMYQNANGHIYYDIANKSVVDAIYADTGIAWYYGVDKENQRVFIPYPSANRRKLIKKETNGTAFCNIYSDGWCEQGRSNINFAKKDSYTYLRSFKDDTYLLLVTKGGWGDGNERSDQGITAKTVSSFTYGNTGSKAEFGSFLACGYLANAEGISKSIKPDYSYMIVGNTSEVTNVTTTVPADEVMTQLNKVSDEVLNRVKIDGSNAEFPYITDTYVNGTSGYIIYSNGYCEQWGKIARTEQQQNVTLLKPYNNTNYNIFFQGYNASANTDYRPILSYEGNKTTSSFIFNCYTGIAGAYWKTAGYIGSNRDSNASTS